MTDTDRKDDGLREIIGHTLAWVFANGIPEGRLGDAIDEIAAHPVFELRRVSSVGGEECKTASAVLAETVRGFIKQNDAGNEPDILKLRQALSIYDINLPTANRVIVSDGFGDALAAARPSTQPQANAGFAKIVLDWWAECHARGHASSWDAGELKKRPSRPTAQKEG